MEPVFSRFDSYNFEADQRFVDGLKSLNKSEETDLQDLKLFFYNRFVEPIDRSSYKQWSSSSPRVSSSSGLAVEQLDQKTHPHSDFDVSKNQTDASVHTETQQLSFAEVMRLIQEGKEVPGVKKLDIQPSNQSPTPSQMVRILKPWETASSSK
ncbi:uncharacterized protein LOC110946437 [Acanthochromis polyacanthus]|uniref:uncharacterized protein LOC110946437 n=1 Tax=Acanthochromis polyacanthus TaxID=80966 RepID=UPI000B90119D|nr:uncharacterized protein LOC110946437 [Acanthochromis polyacanthus]